MRLPSGKVEVLFAQGRALWKLEACNGTDVSTSVDLTLYNPEPLHTFVMWLLADTVQNYTSVVSTLTDGIKENEGSPIPFELNVLEVSTAFSLNIMLAFHDTKIFCIFADSGRSAVQ